MAKKPVANAIPSLEDIDQDSVEGSEIVVTFDISGSCIGWALGADRHLVTYGKYIFKTTATQGEKVHAFSVLVASLLEAYQPTVLAIEQPLKRAKVRKHFEYLGVLRVMWKNYRGEHLADKDILDPRKIKKLLHVDPGKTHKENKARMVKKINTLFGLALKIGTTPNNSDDDIADAIAVLAVYWRLNGNAD